MAVTGAWALNVLLLGAGVFASIAFGWHLRGRFSRQPPGAAAVLNGYAGERVRCPVCGGDCAVQDVVDFSKSCEELRGRFLAPSGIPVYYYWCGDCRFCHAPWMAGWSHAQFSERIYNSDYALVDPDYLDARPRANAQSLLATFGKAGKTIRHLDYGGGAGLMSRLLGEAGWHSSSYDPFVQKAVDPASLGRFDLITVYEVFEHVPDPVALVATLASLLSSDGIVLFSTVLNDSQIVAGQRLQWWYAAPRNGHISLYSGKSLAVLGATQDFGFASFSDGFHMYYRQIPAWAGHLAAAARVNPDVSLQQAQIPTG